MITNPILPIPALVVVLGALAVFAIVQFFRAPLRRGSWHWIVRLLMVVALFGIALRPGLPTNLRPPAASGDVDIYFVVDTTSSMAAEDFGEAGEPRLTGVRADIAGIAEALAGSRYSLITFDAETVQRLPLTTDSSAVVSGAKALNQEITAYSAGSSISQPVAFLEDHLATDAEANPERRRILFYFGDGEQTVAEAPGSFASLSGYLDGGAVLGYGTAEGGPMKEFSGYDDGAEPRYISWFSTDGEEQAISMLDRDALETIAQQLGLPFDLREAGASIAPVTDGIDVGAITPGGGEVVQTPEFYWIFAIAFGALALTEIVVLLGALRELRRMREATNG